MEHFKHARRGKAGDIVISSMKDVETQVKHNFGFVNCTITHPFPNSISTFIYVCAE